MECTKREVLGGSRCERLSLQTGVLLSGICWFLAFAAEITPALAQDDDAKRQFATSCGVCHTAEKDAPHRQGPNLFGIFGKKAGKIAEFKYSDELAKADLTWDEATLDRWIEDASVVIPGTSMPYRQRDPDKRKLVIKYLKSLTP